MVTIHRQIDIGEPDSDPRTKPESPRSREASGLRDALRSPESRSHDSPHPANTRDFVGDDPAATATFYRGGSYGLASVSIRVSASGDVHLSGTAWGTGESVEHIVSLGADVGRAVIDAFIEEGFLDIQLGEGENGVPGEITLAIDLSANGRSHSLSKWSRQEHAGFDRLYALPRPFFEHFPADIRKKLQV